MVSEACTHARKRIVGCKKERWSRMGVGLVEVLGHGWVGWVLVRLRSWVTAGLDGCWFG